MILCVWSLVTLCSNMYVTVTVVVVGVSDGVSM